MDGNINSSWAHITYTTNDQLGYRCSLLFVVFFLFLAQLASLLTLRKFINGIEMNGSYKALPQTPLWESAILSDLLIEFYWGWRGRAPTTAFLRFITVIILIQTRRNGKFLNAGHRY